MVQFSASLHSGHNRAWAPDAALITLAALVVLSRQFIAPGHYYLADDDAAMMSKYVPQFIESFRQGVWYPRWMPDDFAGYGSPAFVFYSPLLYWLAALGCMSGLDIFSAASLLELVRLLLGSAFVYLLVQEKYGGRAGVYSALFYIFLPARVMDLYYWNSPAGRFSQGFMPMAAYFMRRFMADRFSRTNLMLAGASYACIVLSHLATAFIFTPFLAAYSIFGTGVKAGARSFLKSALAVAAGLSLTAFFFMPVLFERGLVHLEFIGRFSYRGNFVFGQYGDAITGNREHILNMIRNMAAFDTVVLVLFLFMGRRLAGLVVKRETGLFIAAVAACIFMMSPLSMPLWRYLPGLSTVQFPSRFETVSMFFVSVVTGVAAHALFTAKGRLKAARVLGAAALLAVAVMDARLVLGSRPYSEAAVRKTAMRLELPEYLPATADPGIIAYIRRDEKRLTSDEPFESDISRWGPTVRKFYIDSPQGAELRIKTFFFPGWRAWVDDTEVAVDVQDKTGAMLVKTPPGRHAVELRFTNTPVRTIGAALSIFTLAALLLPYRRLRYLLIKAG